MTQAISPTKHKSKAKGAITHHSCDSKEGRPSQGITYKKIIAKARLI